MKISHITLALLFVMLPLRSQDTVNISSDVKLIRISQNAYVHVSYCDLPGYGRVPANGLVFTHNNRAFLFDTPWNDSLTEELLTYLEEKMKLKIEGFVPNHWHEDCMGGLAYLKTRKIKSYSNTLTRKIAADNGLPVPDYGFSDSLVLRLGRKEICCYIPGAAHSLDNIVVWIPSEKILFPGCICKSAESPNLGNTADGDLKAYPSTVEWIIRKFPETETVIPGHGSYGGPDLLNHTLSLAVRR